MDIAFSMLGKQKGSPLSGLISVKCSDFEANVIFLHSGNMYLNGHAVEQNYKLALQFFQLGVKKGKYK